MFDNLSNKLQNIFAKLKGHGRLSEANVDEVLREIRIALLEADTNFKAVKELIARIRERSIGAEVMESLTPAQQVIKIVKEELISLLGKDSPKINLSSKLPTLIFMVGLQGSGKTTSSAKLANHFKKLGKKPLLIGVDVYRPAAVDQLEALAQKIGALVYFEKESDSPSEIVRRGLKRALSEACEVVIVDTAGRLHIDEEMMDELKALSDEFKPDETILVVDSMMGQDAVNMAIAFKERVDFTGLLLTKLDGDSKGGAALSIKAATGVPIKLISTGEKMDSLELFHPDRLVSRMLGLGDVLTLIEKVEASLDAENAVKLAEKIKKDELDLNDFLAQMQGIRKMGSFDQILSMMPKIPGLKTKSLPSIDDAHFKRMEAIIASMTREEKENPRLINGSRRQRIAKGSGTRPSDINQLLKQFNDTKKMMKQFGNLNTRAKMGKKILPHLNF
ncbi:MAG: signal recognition particle protein [Actinomycetota bacterium]|nr:signal recognition particle protein [Actinomycetota bacterium]